MPAPTTATSNPGVVTSGTVVPRETSGVETGRMPWGLASGASRKPDPRRRERRLSGWNAHRAVAPAHGVRARSATPDPLC